MNVDFDVLVRHALKLASAHVIWNLNGDHGIGHWQRVREFGVHLAAATPGADPEVVVAFAAIHDTQRWYELEDPGHGPRAAAAARELHECGQLEPLTTRQVRLLVKAIRIHNGSGPVSDPTIGCCLDADRLDLPRVGIEPDPWLMSTRVGRMTAERRAL